jgi:hypothetical protein
MSAMAKAAAAAGVALATVAAAQRQYIAAQSTGRYGGSFSAASAGLRTLQGDARLASLGMKSLNSAFIAASKNAKVTGGTASAIAGLMDFAVASGDIEKGAQAVATLVSLVQKGGAGQKGVLEAAKQLGPEFEKAFTEATKGGKATSAELMKLFSSGELAQKAGLAGGFAATRGSLVGQLKAFMTEMQVMFADLGMRFIEPMQKAFGEIRRIMVRTVTEISPLLNNFAQETMIDKIVNGVDKISQFLVTLMQKYVPATQGFFSMLSRGWDKLTAGFERFNAYLRKFSDASKIINKFFGQILGAIGGGLKTNFEAFAVLLVENKDDFDKFGKSLANLITRIFDLFGAIRQAFMSALPAISTLADAIARIVTSIADLLRMLTGVGGGAGGLGGLAALMLPLYAGLNFRGKGPNAGRMSKGFSKMSAGKQLGVGAAVLGTAALGQIPGVGDAAMSVAGPAALAAMFAPAGFVAPAAIAGATYGGANYAAGAAQRATGGNAAAGIGAGAAVGALGGGILGGMFGGSAMAGAMFGAAAGPVGIIGGAIVGLIAGGIIGIMNNSKLKKQAKEAGKKFTDTYADSVEQMLGSNDLEAATKALSDFDAAAKEFAKTQTKSGTAEKAAQDEWKKRSKGFEDSIKMMGARFTDLERITGMTTDQIRDLANAAEVDLGNGMLTLKQILEATGVATVRFGQEFNNTFTNSYASAVSQISTAFERLRAPQVINESAQSLREKALAGTLTQADMEAGLQTLMQQQLLLSGGDPLAAFKQLTMDLGAGPGGGGQFNTPGNVFYDKQGRIKQAFASAGFDTARGAAFGALQGDLANMVAENLIGGAAGVGMTLGIGKEALVSRLSGMGASELIGLAERVRQPGFFTTPGGVNQLGTQGGGIPFEQQLRNVFKDPNLVAALKPDKTDEEKTRQAMREFGLGATGFKTLVNEVFAKSVGAFQIAVDDFQAGGDTASPRRNIVNTLGAHSRFDAMISGNRTVTSGYRTWGLGSLGSDHAAGRAYDLVGQNLGLYQMAVRAGGGFAEFHGSGGGRHLHVVPNTAPMGVGDRASAISPAVTAPSSGGGMVLNMTVNAAPGMDAQALASEVMARIERAQRSAQERR